MSDIYIDPRTLKTKALIMKTFSEMIYEMDLSKITVKKITDRVGINRKTFYHHFEDINDLIRDFQKSNSDNVAIFLQSYIDNFDLYNWIKHSYYYSAENILLISRLSFNNDMNSISNNIWNEYVNRDEFMNVWKKFKNPELVKSYLLGSYKAIFNYWYTNQSSMTLEELSTYAADLIMHGLESQILDCNLQKNR